MAEDSVQPVTIEKWTAAAPRWTEVAAVVTELGQEAWLSASAPYYRSDHVLVALVGGQIVGFLRFVVQEIGLELDHPAITHGGAPLIEAKILAFGVLSG